MCEVGAKLYNHTSNVIKQIKIWLKYCVLLTFSLLKKTSLNKI